MKITVNNEDINFKIRYTSDSYMNKTITFTVNADRLLSFYDWDKIQEIIEETINERK